MKRVACSSAAALCGAAIVVAVFRPGYMSSDCIDQLRHARAGVYLSVHAPLMGWLWGRLDRLDPGPMGMLVFQNLVLWSGLAMFAYAWARRWAPIAILAIGLYPSVFAEMGTIWKDVHMGVALALAAGFLALARQRRSLAMLAAAVVALWYASSMRLNAAAAVLPLAILAGVLARDLLGRGGAGTALVAGVAVMAAVLLGTRATNAVLHAVPAPALQAPLIHDLVGISTATGRRELPDFEFSSPGAPTEAQARQSYRPETLDPLFFGPRPFRQTVDPAQLKELRERWLLAVWHHPGTYLEHRLGLFRVLIGFRQPEVWYPYHWQIDPNDLGVTMTRTALNGAAMRVLASVRNTFFFRAWIHLALSALILAGALALRRGAMAVALASSALLYTAPYLFVAPSPDFRYVWWPVLASLLALVAFVAGMRALPPSHPDATVTGSRSPAMTHHQT